MCMTRNKNCCKVLMQILHLITETMWRRTVSGSTVCSAPLISCCRWDSYASRRWGTGGGGWCGLESRGRVGHRTVGRRWCGLRRARCICRAYNGGWAVTRRTCSGTWLCGGNLSGRTCLQVGRRQDLDISTVDKSLRFISLPVISCGPPPLKHAVLTWQSRGQFQGDGIITSASIRQGPFLVTILQFQHVVIEISLRDRRIDQWRDAEYEIPFMIGCYFYSDFNQLSFVVGLHNRRVICERTRVDISGVADAVFVPTCSTFALVLRPLHIPAATAELVVSVLIGTSEAIAPAASATRWNFEIAMTSDQTKKHREKYQTYDPIHPLNFHKK